MEAKDRHDIVKVETYMDGKGGEVREYIQMFGKDKKPNFFRGTVLLGMSQVVNGVKTPPRPMPLEFEIPSAQNVKQAFEMLYDTARAEIEKKNAEQEAMAAANRIIPASNISAPKLALR